VGNGAAERGALSQLLKRIAVWIAVGVAAVVAVRVLLREGPPPSLVEPPRTLLPGVDSRLNAPAGEAADGGAVEEPDDRDR
jgi:hypothetical protein